MEKDQPLVLVFYLDRELMTNKEIIIPFTKSVENLIKKKDLNVLAFFMPTDDDERIECLNPKLISESQMKNVDKIIQDLSKNFDVGLGADEGKNNPNNEIIIDG
jgi:hypothetical protein